MRSDNSLTNFTCNNIHFSGVCRVRVPEKLRFTQLQGVQQSTGQLVQLTLFIFLFISVQNGSIAVVAVAVFPYYVRPGVFFVLHRARKGNAKSDRSSTARQLQRYQLKHDRMDIPSGSQDTSDDFWPNTGDIQSLPKTCESILLLPPPPRRPPKARHLL